ncbi:MAG TPA: cation:proton antiporter [Acidimicrobiales bacterium]|nr:cation:proton antiporter [Acidimicrobiales bacterium]
MSHFSSLTEHQNLVLWTQLLVVVGLARGLGVLCRRFGQPPVVGELAAGVVLGPSVLGHVWSAGFDWLFPTSKVQAAALGAVGWVGVGFLLVLTGFETDLAIIRRLGRAASSVAVGGLVVPFACGAALAAALPASFLGPRAHRPVFVIFLGVALSISSLPVIAKILSDLGLMRRNFGQATVAVGMVNDLVGWMALGVIAGLAESGRVSGGRLVFVLVAAVLLLVATFTVGQGAVDRILRAVRARSDSVVAALTVTVVITFALATAAQAIHLEAVLGAFLAGIILGRSRFQNPEVPRHLESVTMSVLAPIFFATAGLRLNLGLLGRPSTLLWCAAILAVAILSKTLGAYAGARLGRLAHREGIALGSALNARGAVEVVIATVGLSLGVLGEGAYTAVVVMAIITSIMAPPILRMVVRDWRGEAEERERLEHEELLDRNLLVRSGSLLLPSRGRPNSIVAAQILHFAWPAQVGVTVLSVDDEGGVEPDLSPIMNVFMDREVDVRRVADDDALAAILAEARLGYQAIGVGVADGFSTGGVLLSPVVDELLADSPIPLVIVRRARGQVTTTPAAFARALVPVSGSPASRTAQEVAFSLGQSLGTAVMLAHVVNRPEPAPVGGGRHQASRWRWDAGPSDVGGGDGDDRPGGSGLDGGSAASAVLDQAMALGAEFQVEASAVTRTGTATADELLAAASEVQADLIVLGATVKRLEGRPFLGHSVEHILDEAPMTVVVVATPVPA